MRAAAPSPSPTPDISQTVRDTAGATADLVTTSLRIALVVVLALVVRALLHRVIGRVVTRASSRSAVPEALRQRFGDVSPGLAEARRTQRAETIGSVLRSGVSLVVFGIGLAMVLSELGFDLGPVLASAGILGVALGFGAQNLVKDYLNGIFMILEDQYGVGDAIDVGEASGIVEAVALRTTRLRSVDGTVWHVRNGEVLRVGNMSQGWSRALIDVSVAYGSDVDHAQGVIKRTADEVWHGEAVGRFVLEEPEVWGVEVLGADGIDVRLVVKTAPLEQWKVARELRRQLKAAFDAEGIEIPFPQRSLWLRTEPDGERTPVTEPASRPVPSPVPTGGEADAMRADTSALATAAAADPGSTASTASTAETAPLDPGDGPRTPS